MRRCISLLTLCLALFASACGAARETPEAAPGELPSEHASSSRAGTGGQTSAPENPAPDFTITTFEGEVFSLREQRGTPVVLNFWESW